MRLPTTRLRRLSPVLPWQRWVGKALVVGLMLPSLAASADTLEPIRLRKTWESTPVLEPIILKKPAAMMSQEAPVAHEWSLAPLPETQPAASLTPVMSAPAAHELHTGAAADDLPIALGTTVDSEEILEESPPAPVVAEQPTQNFNEKIQSLADQPRQKPAPTEPRAQVVLPANLGRVTVSADAIQNDDQTINTIIDIADQYADVPQLLLEVRGLAPMTASNQERQLAYQNAVLVVSGLVSAGIPVHHIAAFVTLLNAAPGSVDIIRTR